MPTGPSRTKHGQLRDAVAAQVAGLPAHHAIASERELMATHGVSRATVRTAIQQLVAEGVLYTVHGKGTFVAGERVQSQLHLASFTDDMRRRGLMPATVVRSVEHIAPTLDVQAALGLGPDAEVIAMERLRLAGGAPMALERSFYRADLFPGFDTLDLTRSMYDVAAQQYGLRIDNAEQTVWSEVTDEVDGALLGVGAGAPLMVFRRTACAGTTPVEHVISRYRGDRYQIHMHLASDD